MDSATSWPTVRSAGGRAAGRGSAIGGRVRTCVEPRTYSGLTHSGGNECQTYDMRRLAVFVALAALAGSIVGGAAASRNALPIIKRDAVSPIWSPDGKQLLFADVGYASTDSGLFPTQLRIVRT